ncbi:MAG: hypothetical protein SF028_05535 [Candidatus Sumerlaeia bacterium]|nr:hypothetical protein [Candidatus Sumerlaeia bacterium]
MAADAGPDGERFGPVQRWEWLALLLATALGGAIRFWAMRRAPGLWYDEAWYALEALDLLRNPGWPIFFSGGGHMREPLFMYLLAPVFHFFGPTVETARGTCVAIGTLTIPAFWWMARGIDGRRVAIAVLFLAVPFRWHVHFSSLCFRTILTPLFAALLAGAVARWLRGGGPRWAAVAGAFLGAGLYTYTAWRLAPVALAAGGALLWWRARRDGSSLPAGLRREAAAFAACAFVVAAPLLLHYLRRPDQFAHRAGEVELEGRGRSRAAILAAQARDVALMFAFRGDHVGKHNLPGGPGFLQARLWSVPGAEEAARWQDARAAGAAPDPHGTGLPLFDVATGLLFYAGIALFVSRALRGPAGPEGPVLAWLAVGSLASVLSFGAPNYLRLTLLMPAVLLVLGAAACELHRRLAARGGALASTVLALLFANYAAVELRRAASWPEHPMVPREFNVEFRAAGEALRPYAGGPPVKVPAYLGLPPTLRFCADGVRLVAADGAPGEREWLELHPLPPWPPFDGPAPPPGAAVERAATIQSGGAPWGYIVRVRVPAAPSSP